MLWELMLIPHQLHLSINFSLSYQCQGNPPAFFALVEKCHGYLLDFFIYHDYIKQYDY